MREREMLENMQMISSKWTFWGKRIFPLFWFGFLGVFFCIALLGKFTGKQGDFPVIFLLVPVVMAIFGYFLMKKLVFDLVDEAWDAGDKLIIKNRGVYDEIALADIINVNFNGFTNPPRITLRLRRPSQFGEEVTFSPPQQWWPFSTPPIVNDLITRVDAARRRAIN